MGNSDPEPWGVSIRQSESFVNCAIKNMVHEAALLNTLLGATHVAYFKSVTG